MSLVCYWELIANNSTKRDKLKIILFQLNILKNHYSCDGLLDCTLFTGHEISHPVSANFKIFIKAPCKGKNHNQIVVFDGGGEGNRENTTIEYASLGRLELQ